MRFGISTHLYNDHRLGREHLAQIAAHGFEAVEVFAKRSHFDYHDPGAIAQLAEWLTDTGLVLHGVHAPTLDTAAGSAATRQEAVREADAALNIARQIPADVFVVHLGTPAGEGGESNRTAAYRSLEEICRLAEPIGIKVAVEVIPNALSDGASLVTLLERDLDVPRTGICLDFGHAFLMGDVVDTIEAVAEHLITTHIHDNKGKKDEHLVPFEGRIDWDIALMTLQKVGYEGTYMMELGNTSSPATVLDLARSARARFEKLMAY
jgi:sugar phosphate isomerase/epimerase